MAGADDPLEKDFEHTCKSQTHQESYSIEFPSNVVIDGIPKGINYRDETVSYSSSYTVKGRILKVNPTDAGVQVVLKRANYHRRDRNHAHDSQGADELPRRLSHVRSTAVLQPRCLITRSATQLFSARLHYCDKTNKTVGASISMEPWILSVPRWR